MQAIEKGDDAETKAIAGMTLSGTARTVVYDQRVTEVLTGRGSQKNGVTSERISGNGGRLGVCG